MTISMILAEKGHKVITARPDMSLRDAAAELMRCGIGALVVVDAQGTLLGLVAERDIVAAIAIEGANALDTPVTVHMQTNCAPVGENNTVSETMQIMTVERRRHIPVTRNGQLAGLISIGDVVKHRLRVIEEEHRSMREYIAQS